MRAGSGLGDEACGAIASGKEWGRPAIERHLACWEGPGAGAAGLCPVCPLGTFGAARCQSNHTELYLAPGVYRVDGLDKVVSLVVSGKSSFTVGALTP